MSGTVSSTCTRLSALCFLFKESSIFDDQFMISFMISFPIFLSEWNGLT